MSNLHCESCGGPLHWGITTVEASTAKEQGVETIYCPECDDESNHVDPGEYEGKTESEKFGDDTATELEGITLPSGIQLEKGSLLYVRHGIEDYPINGDIVGIPPETFLRIHSLTAHLGSIYIGLAAENLDTNSDALFGTVPSKLLETSLKEGDIVLVIERR